MTATLHGRSFTSAAPALWNSLPADLRVPTTLGVFKSIKLKVTPDLRGCPPVSSRKKFTCAPF